MISSSRQNILIIKVLTVILTLKLAKQSLCKTLQFMMMHNHTAFGYRRLSSSEDIVWTNINLNFEPSL